MSFHGAFATYISIKEQDKSSVIEQQPPIGDCKYSNTNKWFLFQVVEYEANLLVTRWTHSV